MKAIIAIDERYVPHGCQYPESHDFTKTCNNVEALNFHFFVQLMWPNNHRYRRFTSEGSVNQPSNDTVLGALSLGIIETEMATYTLTPERVRQTFAFTSPILQYQPSLFYSALLDTRPPATILNGALGLLSAFPPLLLSLSLCVQTSWNLFTAVSRTNQGIYFLRHHPINIRYISMLAAMPLAVTQLAFAQNAKGRALNFLKTVKPFNNLNDVLPLLKSGSLNLQFYSEHSLHFKQVNNSLQLNSPLGRIRDTFDTNPPTFSPRLKAKEKPNTLYLGYLSSAAYSPCVKEALWMRRLIPPHWIGYIFRQNWEDNYRRGRESSKTLERANMFAEAVSADLPITTSRLFHRTKNLKASLDCDGWLNDSSVVSLVAKGEADMSMPFMSINARRSLILGFTPTIFRTRGAVLYRKHQATLVKLSFQTLIPVEIVYAIAFLASFKATTILANRILIPVLDGKYGKDMSRPISKLGNALAWTLLINTIAGHLTTLFILPLPKRLPFQKPGEIRRNPYNFSIMAQSPNAKLEINHKIILVSPSRYNNWLVHPPKELVRRNSRMALYGAESVLLSAWQRHCKFRIFVDEDVTVDNHILYNRQNNPFRKLNSVLTAVGSREAQRAHMYPIKSPRNCLRGHKSANLKLEQLEPGFRIFAGVLGMAVIVMLLEFVISIVLGVAMKE